MESGKPAYLRHGTLLRDTGYEAYYSVELSTARYTEVGAQLARMRDVGERWRLQALGE